MRSLPAAHRTSSGEPPSARMSMTPSSPGAELPPSTASARARLRNDAHLARTACDAQPRRRVTHRREPTQAQIPEARKVAPRSHGWWRAAGSQPNVHAGADPGGPESGPEVSRVVEGRRVAAECSRRRRSRRPGKWPRGLTGGGEPQGRSRMFTQAQIPEARPADQHRPGWWRAAGSQPNVHAAADPEGPEGRSGSRRWLGQALWANSGGRSAV